LPAALAMGRQASRLSSDVAIHFWQNFNCASVADMLAVVSHPRLKDLQVADGINSEKPIRIKMMPLKIRTMLSGTSKISSNKVPKIRKKNVSNAA
jgi:hypothetical protein